MFEPTFTPNTLGGRATLATQAVGAGQWLVAVQITKATFNAATLWINNAQVTGASTAGAPASSTAVVEGPATIMIDGGYIGSGHVRIVRID